MFLAHSQCSPCSPKVGGLGFCVTLPIVRAVSFCYGQFLLFAEATGFAAHMEVLIIIPKQL